jgi:hypothetical protein
MRLMGPKQAAYHLGVSVRTLEDWRTSVPMKGPAFFKMEGRVYYKEEDLDIFLDACRVVPQEQPSLPFGVLIQLEERRRERANLRRRNCGASDLWQLPIFAIKAG